MIYLLSSITITITHICVSNDATSLCGPLKRSSRSERTLPLCGHDLVTSCSNYLDSRSRAYQIVVYANMMSIIVHDCTNSKQTKQFITIQ